MNQILITGDEQIQIKETPKRKEKKVLPVNVIIRFFAISIIILGICIVSGSVYARDQINKTVLASKTPEISVERNDEDNTILINVTHIRKLKTVTYKWNDEEEVAIDTRNQAYTNELIKLIGGENTLTVYAVDESGKEQRLIKKFMAGNIPKIDIDAVDNGVQVNTSSDDIIDYIEYSWDYGDVQKIEVREKQYEGIINAPRGKHMLRIEVVTENNMKAELEKEVIGDTEPTVNVQSLSVNNKPTFVIDIEDDEGITTVSIIHNGGEKQTINVNAKTFHQEVQMVENEENTIIITATNINGLEKTRRIRIRK